MMGRGLPDRYVWWAGICQTGTYGGQGFARQVRMVGRDLPDRYVWWARICQTGTYDGQEFADNYAWTIDIHGALKYCRCSNYIVTILFSM